MTWASELLEGLTSWDFLKSSKEARNNDYFDGLCKGRDRTINDLVLAVLKKNEEINEECKGKKAGHTNRVRRKARAFRELVEKCNTMRGTKEVRE